MSLKAYLTAKQAFFVYILQAPHGLIEMNEKAAFSHCAHVGLD